MTLPTINQVMSYYLFGSLTPPAEKAAEAVIPASGARDSFPIEIKMSDFMNGPGRFANGATLGFDSGETKIIERFFDGDIPLSPGRYSLSQILGGSGSVRYGFQSVNWSGDLIDDYAYRAFIWQSFSVAIDPKAVFVVEQNGEFRGHNTN